LGRTKIQLPGRHKQQNLHKKVHPELKPGFFVQQL
jgi:hypothetical protein